MKYNRKIEQMIKRDGCAVVTPNRVYSMAGYVRKIKYGHDMAWRKRSIINKVLYTLGLY
ncbi:MAG: hypothetical protein AAB927_04255 [Patescibacteria group bacterium]